jgi:chromosome segregation ATPase
MKTAKALGIDVPWFFQQRADEVIEWCGREDDNDCADEVTLSRKGAKSRRRITSLRSKTTKTITRVSRVREPQADLKQQLEACRRELVEAREHVAEALEQQAATSQVLQVISRVATWNLCSRHAGKRGAHLCGQVRELISLQQWFVSHRRHAERTRRLCRTMAEESDRCGGR